MKKLIINKQIIIPKNQEIYPKNPNLELLYNILKESWKIFLSANSIGGKLNVINRGITSLDNHLERNLYYC